MGITKKNCNVYRKDYQNAGYGTVDDISHIFGLANHERFYGEMKSWESLANSMMSDSVWNIIPLSWVKWLIVTLIGKIYDAEARNSYWKGVDMGKSIVGKVEQVVQWASSEIKANIDKVTSWAQGEVQKINTYIQTDIYPPLENAKAQIAQFSQTITGIQPQVDDVVNRADQALSNAQSAYDQVQAQIPTINDLVSKAQNAASSIDNLTGDASTKSKQISDIVKELANLNKKISKLEKNNGSSGGTSTGSTDPTPSIPQILESAKDTVYSILGKT